MMSGDYPVDVDGVERAHEIAAPLPEAAVPGDIRAAHTLTQEDSDALKS